jgi:gluconolactonase
VRAQFYGVERPQELSFQGVYRVGPDPTSPVLLADDFDRPNGLCFSLDERQLFINDTARKHIRVFDVTPTGGLTGGRLWSETVGERPGAPDGMKIDAQGNVYCCGPGGIHVFEPGGSLREVTVRIHRQLRLGRRGLSVALRHRLHFCTGFAWPRGRPVF